MSLAPGRAPEDGRTPIHARPGIVLALWALGCALCIGVILHTPFKADLSAFLPAAPNAQQRLLIEQLQSGAPARSLTLAIAGGQPAQRVQASSDLATALRQGGHFEWVHNGGSAGVGELGSWVFEQRYALSPAVNAQRFSAEGMALALDDTVALLGTPAGSALKPLLNRDPTGEALRIAESQLSAQGPRQDHGVWVTRDGQRALLLASTRAPGADMDAQGAALAAARSAFAALRQPQLSLVLSGAPVFAIDTRARIEHEVRVLAMAGTLLMVGLLWLAFGSLQAVALAALPVATGVLVGVAAVGLGFGNVHGVTLAFGTTLIGEAVDYAIYYLLQGSANGSANGGTNGGDASRLQRWQQHGWPTVRLGLLTSVCGFAALAFSGFPGLAQLGVFSLAGLTAAALCTRFVLPLLRPARQGGQAARGRLGALALALARHAPRARTAVWFAAAACLLALAWQPQTLWRADLTALSPISPEALALDASLRQELALGEGGAFLVVQAADAQAALRGAEAAGLALDELVDQGRLQGYDSPARLLPSLALQAQRRQALPEPAALRAALARATQGGPLPAARLVPFTQDLERARQAAPLTLETLPSSAGALVRALLMPQRDGRWAAILPLHALPGQLLGAALLAPAVQAAPGVQWLDVGAQLRQLYQHYLAQAMAQAGWGAAGVVALMALWLRSPRRLLAVCQPLALALLFTLAALSVLDVPLGILHLVGLLLVVAVGSNYALFFDMLRQQGQADAYTNAETLASLLLANLTTVLSFGLIAASSIPALSDIGRVVAPGALLALLLAAVCGAPAAPRQA